MGFERYGQRNVQAVVNAAIESCSYHEGEIEMRLGGDRCDAILTQFCQAGLCFGQLATPRSNRFPEETSHFRPEQIWNDELNFVVHVLDQQLGRFLGQRLVDTREHPFCNYARVHDDLAQRARSSRCISSVEGNRFLDCLPKRIWLSFLMISRLARSSFSVGMFCSRSATTSAAMERRPSRARRRRASYSSSGTFSTYRVAIAIV